MYNELDGIFYCRCWDKKVVCFCDILANWKFCHLFDYSLIQDPVGAMAFTF